MTPTMELRFVEREIAYTGKYEQVLQQKWIGLSQYVDSPEVVEWRDVPLVKEVN